MAEVIQPALQAGKIVICDRYISATCAYQGHTKEDIDRILELGIYAIGSGKWPDLTLVLDVPPEEGFKRIQRKHDAMESRSLEYHRSVYERFCGLRDMGYPGHVELIDGTGSPENVHERIVEVLARVDF
jgi:dTMP kinase